ncbi:MAG: branched-chain amino acid ABC transporter permease [Lachnospiraceae bacterium]|nr:branched-chain amino acid ABC transporter permease [Lachnospiraceae bacterium]
MKNTVSIFIQSLINGLNQGAIYALIALGYTMVYGILRMINFAHGDFIMVGSYTLFYTVPLMVNHGMPAWLAVFVAIVVCVIVGVLVESIAYKPVRNSGSISALITALAMSLFLENLAMVLFGGNPKTIAKIFDLPLIDILGAKIQVKYLLTLGIGLVIMVAMTLFVRVTKIGKAMRAVPQDREAATIVGINVDRIITITFAIGSALAAVAALMYCSTYPRATTDMGTMMGIKAFIAAVLGGIGIIPGAMLGGILIGLIEIFVKVYLAPGWYEAITYAILIVVLLIKPSGILGRNVSEKV